MERKKKTATAVTAVMLVVAVAAACTAIALHRSARQYDLLMSEVAQVNEQVTAELTGNIDRQELTMLLERRAVGGKYAPVESAYKNYMDDLFVIIYDATDAVSGSGVMSVLSPESLADGAPELKEQKAAVAELSSRLSKDLDDYNAMKTASAVDSYASRSGLSGRQLETYRGIMSAYINAENGAQDNFGITLGNAVERCAAAEDALEILSENPDGWFVADGKLKFRSSELYNSYSEIVGRK